jgi:putative transposase
MTVETCTTVAAAPSEFTSLAFTDALKRRGVAISLDDKGSWHVFDERPWRTIKYEEVYLRAYDSVSDARQRLARYIEFYNARRPHSALGAQAPDEFYFATLPANQQVA